MLQQAILNTFRISLNEDIENFNKEIEDTRKPNGNFRTRRKKNPS